MKKLANFLFGFLIVFVLLSCNKSKDNFTVSGTLELPVKAKVKLMNLGVDKAATTDSVLVEQSKSFKLNGSIDNSALFSLRIEGFKDIFLVIHPGDEIQLDIDNATSPSAYSVQGSTDSRLVNEIMTKHNRTRDKITQLSIDYENSKQTPETFQAQKVKFDSIYDHLLTSHKNETSTFIKLNAQSLACIFALYQDFGKQKSQPLYDVFSDIEIFNLVDSSLSIRYPKTEAVIALNRDVTDIKEKIKLREYTENLIEPGKKAPQFELTDIAGTSIKLEEYAGKPVLFVFFAVWNKESAAYVLELNQLVSKYAYRNLKVIGVSFDTSPEKLNGFISANDIRFPVACDYKYWDSQYVKQFGINAIPDIILLDNNHIIHTRSILFPELSQIISEWKKSKLL